MAESQSNPDASELTVDEAPGSEADGQQKELKQGLVLVSEGYYKYTDVLFDWPKCLSGWHVCPISSLMVKSYVAQQHRGTQSKLC